MLSNLSNTGFIVWINKQNSFRFSWNNAPLCLIIHTDYGWLFVTLSAFSWYAAFRMDLTMFVVCLCCPACEAMPGHAGRRQGLLPGQQGLHQRPQGDGTPVDYRQNDGGEKASRHDFHQEVIYTHLLSCVCQHVHTQIMSYLLWRWKRPERFHFYLTDLK